MPVAAENIANAVRHGLEVVPHTLKKELSARVLPRIGDEAAFAPTLAPTRDALIFILNLLKKQATNPVKEDLSRAGSAGDTNTSRTAAIVLSAKGKSVSAENVDYLAALCATIRSSLIEDGIPKMTWGNG